MSDVVGTCGDCIISVPNASPNSLKFSVSVDEGVNKIIKHRANVSGYYPTATGLSVQSITLEPSGTYSPGLPVSALLISCNAPIQATLVSNGVSITLPVNQLLSMDSGFDSVSVTNVSTTDNVQITLAFTNP